MKVSFLENNGGSLILHLRLSIYMCIIGEAEHTEATDSC